MVHETGIEPARPFDQGSLSPLRLPNYAIRAYGGSYRTRTYGFCFFAIFLMALKAGLEPTFLDSESNFLPVRRLQNNVEDKRIALFKKERPSGLLNSLIFDIWWTL